MCIVEVSHLCKFGFGRVRFCLWIMYPVYIYHLLDDNGHSKLGNHGMCYKSFRRLQKRQKITNGHTSSLPNSATDRLVINRYVQSYGFWKKECIRNMFSLVVVLSTYFYMQDGCIVSGMFLHHACIISKRIKLFCSFPLIVRCFLFFSKIFCYHNFTTGFTIEKVYVQQEDWRIYFPWSFSRMESHVVV